MKFYEKISWFRPTLEAELGGKEKTISLVTILMRMMHKDSHKRPELTEISAVLSSIFDASATS